jgi:DNA-binding SARP family transcriptional activator/tetratricopeptide (TPR) repeat protein
MNAQRAPALTVRVCGDFAATVGGCEVPLGGPRQKAVLARVLAGDGEVVSAEQVVDDVWGARSIDSTVASVHAYVSRLRRLLGSAAIPRRAGGYVLDRQVITVDADQFVADVTGGRRALAHGDDAAAEALLESALSRWRGPTAFGEMRDAHFLGPAAARLEELRVVAGEALADARARRGHSADDVDLLEELAARDPLRESIALRLVRALYAAGRQADALAAYDRCRRELAEQLGVDPAPPLRRIHAAVLAQEPAMTAASSVLPIRLPPRNRSFVGRDALLDEIQAALDDDTHRPRAVALTGLAGIGKTDLACELAHRRLRQSRVAWWIAAEDPAGTAAGLGALATALGIAPFERGEDTRAALWAELDRSPGWILVFDNADDPAALEPFLPAARHGDVVITSRNPAWRRLARPLAVTPLLRAESVAYVTARTSGDPPGGVPGDADALAALLGDLPLALEQASAYIEQTGMSVLEYVRLFQVRRVMLLLRDASSSGPTVATTWGLAFDRLRERSADAAALLETIAFLAPDAIAVDLLAPLAADELDLHDMLAELRRLSLVDRDGGILRIHRLVQDVVRARMPEETRRTRLGAAARICVATAGADAHLVSVAAHAEALGAVPAGLVDALARLARRYADRALYPAAEHVLTMALRLQDGDRDPVRRGDLTCRLGEVLDAAGRLGPALELHRRAVGILSAVVAPDPLVLAHAYNRLGHVLNCADDAGAAIEAHRRALDVLRAADREDLAAPVLVDLGYTLWGTGRLDEAGVALRRGRAELERHGLREHRDWAHATAGLGLVEQDCGRVETAVELQRTAIAAFTRVCGPDHPDTAQALDKLGYALRLQGRAREAVDAHRRAVRLLERVLGPDDSRVAMALTNLGLAYADDGHPELAVEAQTRARAVLGVELGAAHGSTIIAARRLAMALAASGHAARARSVMSDVLEMAAARLDDNPAEQARIAAEAALVFAMTGDRTSG